jgi:hypothetical protein
MKIEDEDEDEDEDDSLVRIGIRKGRTPSRC